VRYNPELKRNLISISMFDLMGYITKVENGIMKVSTGASIIAKGRRSNGLYILEGSTVIGQASVASQTMEDKSKLWQLQLGHISDKSKLWHLLMGDKLHKLEFCDQYVLGKSHRVKFGTGKRTSTKPFEYAHADLWGPFRIQTHGGGSYFLSIIHDYSRRVWVYILRNKAETSQKFKE